MGFASMFEEIMEALGGEFQRIVLQEQQRDINHSISQTSRLKAKRCSEPPEKVVKKARRVLSEYDYPPYLIESFINWGWQLEMKQKSMDQIWDEFVRVAIPLITSYLQKHDSITIRFVQKHLLKKGSHWIR